MTMFPTPGGLLIKRGTRTNVRGVYVVATTDIRVQGSCQPLSGRDISNLEPGTRGIGKIWVYADDALNVRTEGDTNPPADVVVYEGQKWEIITREPHTNGIIPHNRYMAEYRGAA